MKRSLAVALAAVFVSAHLVTAGSETASGIRQESPDLFDWRGSYIGLHGGGVFGQTEANDTRAYTNFTGVSNPHADSWSFDTSGFMGGFQWGHLWQSGSLVYGVETNIGYLNLDGSGTLSGDAIDVRSSTESNAYWSTRARFGWAFGRFLIYGAGGAITLNYKASVQGLPGDQDSESELRYGWIGGGGIEYTFNERWSLKAEYLYFELENGSIDIHSERDVSGNTDIFQFDHQSTGNIVSLAINYHLGAATAEEEVSSADEKTTMSKGYGEPEFSWKGLYIGGHLGGASGDLNWTDEPPESSEEIAQHDPSGVFGGVHLGMNTQWGWLIIGNEWKFAYSGIGDEASHDQDEFRRTETEIEWMASTALRVGVASPELFDNRLFPYLKAGMSNAHIVWRGDDPDTSMNGGSHFSTSEGRFAPVWGGGVEYAVTRNWTVRLEYDYADYGEKIIRGGYRQGAFGKESEQFETDLQLHMLEAAVGYKF